MNNYNALVGRKVRLIVEHGAINAAVVLDLTGIVNATWDWHHDDPAFEITTEFQEENLVIRLIEGGTWDIHPLDPEPIPDSIKSIIEAARSLRSDEGINAEYDRALVELIATGIRIPELAHLDGDSQRDLIEGWVRGE